MALRCTLLLLFGCAVSAQRAPTVRSSPEVRAFEEDLERCDEEGEAAADACQEALLVAAACDSGGQGPVCDHLRAEGALPPEPPAMRALFGCWEVIEPGEDVRREPPVGPARPRPTHLCLEEETMLFGYAGIWDRWRIGGRGYIRHDSRAHAGYYASTAVGELQLLVDGDELVLRVPATLIRARLRRSDIAPPAVPTFEQVCGATRRCLEARASRREQADAEGMDTTIELDAWRVSECHCQLLAAARGEVSWSYASQWNEHEEEPGPVPSCMVETLPYDGSLLPTCPPPSAATSER